MTPGVTRRRFIGTTAVASAALALPLRAETGWDALPKGPMPSPLALPHFPSRLHAFVWRNWPLVPAPVLAGVIGATADQVREVAATMGLKAQPPLSRAQLERFAITIIKRNWHVLPYEQLLGLLGWTAERLAYTLREDDFLYIKLGSLKPRCQPLRYETPAEAPLVRAVVEQQFPRVREREPLLAFLDNLSRLRVVKTRRMSGLRMCYSYFGLYGDPFLDPKLDPYPDGYLGRLNAARVNAVWLQGVLQKLAPFPWEPERHRDYEVRLRNLRKLAKRIRHQGLRLFLYLNEPRALPAHFFERHPELKGVTEGEFATLCTSQPEVQEYLAGAVATICRAAPDLGGFFTITASENLTNCWSHGKGAQCPRCGRRNAGEVVAEVNSALWKGIRQSGTTAQLIAWDWGWADAWAEDAISRLPEGVSFMSVSEWSLPIRRGGVESEVGEYSISAIGPGPRAKRHWDAARKRGLRTVAKIQAGNTWELSAVPYIPALRNVAQHGENLRASGIQDVMLGWTLGGYPSPNIEVVTRLLEESDVSIDDAMLSVAGRNFSPEFAPRAVQAWGEVSHAFSEFPYHIGVVYNAPLQTGPANLLWEKPTGYRATMVGLPYDDLDTWRSIYPVETFIAQLEKVAHGISTAVDRLLSGTSAQYPLELLREIGVMRAAEIHFRSVANQARFVQARRALSQAKNAEEARLHVAALAKTLQDEIVLAQLLHGIQSRDSRIGFEASNQYYYIPEDLIEKVLNCRDLLERWIPAERTKWKLS